MFICVIFMLVSRIPNRNLYSCWRMKSCQQIYRYRQKASYDCGYRVLALKTHYNSTVVVSSIRICYTKRT